MSKIFKSSVSNRTIDVTAASTRSVGLILSDDSSLDITIAKTDAPALALAILEAAGVEPEPADSYSPGSLEQLRDASYELRRYINAQAGNAKAAADREALESEAEALWIAAKQDGWIDPDGWDGLGNDSRHMWVSVAKRARTFLEATR